MLESTIWFLLSSVLVAVLILLYIEREDRRSLEQILLLISFTTIVDGIVKDSEYADRVVNSIINNQISEYFDVDEEEEE